jgi:uncharacterized protein YoxC
MADGLQPVVSNTSDFTIRFPFRFPEGCCIGFDGEVRGFSDRGKNWTYSRTGQSYAISVSGFSNREECRDYFGVIRLTLCRAQLFLGRSFDFAHEVKDVRIVENPVGGELVRGADILAEGELPCAMVGAMEVVVYPSNVKLTQVSVGQANVSTTENSDRFLQVLRDGVSHAGNFSEGFDDRLFSSFDLHGAFWRERSDYVKFLSLVTALECLIPERRPPQIVKDTVRMWRADLDVLIQDPSTSAEDKDALGLLRNQLTSLSKRHGSIMHGIQTLVEDVDVESTQIEALKASVKDIYSVRSQILHSAQFPDEALVRSLLNEARSVLEAVLQSKLAKFFGRV